MAHEPTQTLDHLSDAREAAFERYLNRHLLEPNPDETALWHAYIEAAAAHEIAYEAAFFDPETRTWRR